MARNKHPEETVEKILAVSAKLFMERDMSTPPSRTSLTIWED